MSVNPSYLILLVPIIYVGLFIFILCNIVIAIIEKRAIKIAVNLVILLFLIGMLIYVMRFSVYNKMRSKKNLLRIVLAYFFVVSI